VVRFIEVLEAERQTVEETSIKEVEAEIVQTDQLINGIVYELYGLTKEEIEIVEGAVGE
jgi:hypothetical protein